MTVKIDRSNAAQQEFSAYLKNARQQTGYIQAKMAEVLGVQLAAYRRWEVGDGLPQNQERKEEVEQKVDALLRGEGVTEEAIETHTQREPLYDDRTIAEQLQDLGVGVKTVPSLGKRPEEDLPELEPETKNELPKIMDFQWYRNPLRSNYLGKCVSFKKSRISIGTDATKMLGGAGAYVRIGRAMYGIKPVLVIKKASEPVQGETMVLSKEKQTTVLRGKDKIEWLRAQGLDGKYELKPLANREGVFVGLPVEDGGER